jgi:hypothetical protein
MANAQVETMTCGFVVGDGAVGQPKTWPAHAVVPAVAQLPDGGAGDGLDDDARDDALQDIAKSAIESEPSV